MPTPSRPLWSPVEAVTVRATFYNGGAGAARVTPVIRARRRRDWPEAAGEAREVAPGALESWDIALRGSGQRAAHRSLLPRLAAAGRPLRLVGRAGRGARRAVRAADPRARRSRSRPPARAIDLEREVVHRFRDQAVGERRRPLRVVPALEVSVTPDRVLWPVGADGERTLRVVLRKHVADAVAGRHRSRAAGGVAGGRAGRRSRSKPAATRALTTCGSRAASARATTRSPRCA